MAETAPELIVIADRVHSLDEGTPTVQALAITGGRVSALADADTIRALAGPATVVRVLPGATVVPGLVDAHSHPIMSLDLVRGVSLVGVTDMVALRAALEAGRAGLGEDDWFFAWGLDPNAFEGAPLGNALLHELFGPDRLAWIMLFDGHSALASDAALALAGITAPRQFDDGASIAGDSTGRPSGHLLEFTAMKLVQAVHPAVTLGERADQLRELLARMAAAGITEAHVLDMEAPDTLELLTAAEAAGELAVRLRISPWCEPTSTDADLERIRGLQGTHGRRWRIEGVKFFIDGTVEGGTAWLDSPDADGEGLQSFWRDADAYADRIRFFHDHGIPTTTHAIGERGIRTVAQTLAALQPNGVQHRIEHLESVTDDTIALLAGAGIATGMQPTHCTHYVRADGGDDWSRRLGPTRAGRAWRTRDVREAGVTLALGSDWPIAPFEPLAIMADAQLRRPALHEDAPPVRPEQALTARQALEGYTVHAHRSIGAAGGVLAPGARADLTVLDVDPLAADPDALARGRVLLTVLDGVVAFDAVG
ncbi:amidohydrolase [Microbacterium sp.]|uniref:amidohydrolase n=1 Tax=Microbacterium sp. TaxID=51671 RepID=UPI0039E2AC2E